MSKKSHEHGDSHHKHPHSPGWKPHRDWRVWMVAAMLLAMAIYVLTLGESLWPAGTGPDAVPPAVPAVPADAP
ncbi:hypothetical protein NA78x_003921 [Anatilimnocola sp. NA78]|uniref:hypothetical protein n=1 Tax=Anatilimnocola sp. NA78 TaxID=3415683 RepID=UPI003CE45B10